MSQAAGSSRPSRPTHPMPDLVRLALDERKLIGANRSRLPYQQNDDVGWINRTRRPETEAERPEQRLDELRARRRL